MDIDARLSALKANLEEMLTLKLSEEERSVLIESYNKQKDVLLGVKRKNFEKEVAHNLDRRTTLLEQRKSLTPSMSLLSDRELGEIKHNLEDLEKQLLDLNVSGTEIDTIFQLTDKEKQDRMHADFEKAKELEKELAELKGKNEFYHKAKKMTDIQIPLDDNKNKLKELKGNDIYLKYNLYLSAIDKASKTLSTAQAKREAIVLPDESDTNYEKQAKARLEASNNVKSAATKLENAKQALEKFKNSKEYIDFEKQLQEVSAKIEYLESLRDYSTEIKEKEDSLSYIAKRHDVSNKDNISSSLIGKMQNSPLIAPEKPIIPAPTKTTGDAPIQPTSPEPVKPTRATPIQPISPEPVKPTELIPVGPVRTVYDPKALKKEQKKAKKERENNIDTILDILKDLHYTMKDEEIQDYPELVMLKDGGVIHEQKNILKKIQCAVSKVLHLGSVGPIPTDILEKVNNMEPEKLAAFSKAFEQAKANTDSIKAMIGKEENHFKIFDTLLKNIKKGEKPNIEALESVTPSGTDSNSSQAKVAEVVPRVSLEEQASNIRTPRRAQAREAAHKETADYNREH